MALIGPPLNAEEYARYEAEQAEKRRQAAIAAGQPLETEIGSRIDEGFLGMGDSRVPINAYFLDPALAGSMTEMEKASFYDQMRRAEAQGQDIYGQQQNFANALYERSQGRGGPSIAEMQLQQSLNANRQDAARTLAGAGRGINPALARRLLMQQQGSLNQTAAGQAAILRAQEQQAAQAAYGSQLNNMRGTETTLYGSAGQLGLNQAKAQSELAEAQKARDLQLAIENQRAAQKASGQASSESEGQANRDATQTATATKAAGEAAVEAAKAIKNTPPAPKAHGGIIRRYAKGGMVSAKGQEEATKKDIKDERNKKDFMKVLIEALSRPKNPYVGDAEYKKFMDNDEERGAIIRKGIEEAHNVRAGKPYASREEIDARGARLMNNTPNAEDKTKSKAWRAERDLLEMEYRIRNAEEGTRRKKTEDYTGRKPVRSVGPIDLPSAPGRLDPAEIRYDSTGMDDRMGIERSSLAQGGKINAAMGRLTKMDNEKNDVVPAMLSPGEIVIPRSIVSAPNAPMAAHRFVEALLANKGKKDAKMLALKAALGKK